MHPSLVNIAFSGRSLSSSEQTRSLSDIHQALTQDKNKTLKEGWFNWRGRLLLAKIPEIAGAKARFKINIIFIKFRRNIQAGNAGNSLNRCKTI